MPVKSFTRVTSPQQQVGSFAQRMVAASPRTVVTNFDSGHGYTLGSATGTVADDTADFVTGDRSLSLTTDGAAGAAFVQRTSINPAISFQNRYVELLIKVSDYTRVSDLMVYLSSDNFTSYASARILPSSVPTTPWVRSGEWVPVTLSRGEFTITGGTFDWASINAIRLRAKDFGSSPGTNATAGAFTVKFDLLALVVEPPSGLVTITFDDGWISQFTKALPILDKYRFPATAYIIADLIDKDPSYMTLTQLKQLRDLHGWEMASHALTKATHDARFTAVSAAERQRQFTGIRQWLTQRGFRGDQHLALPGGQFDSGVLDDTQRYFASTRTIYEVTRETLPPAMPSRLRCWSVTNTTTAAQVTAAIDRAKANNEWLILCFHQVADAPTVSTEFKTADFQTVVDYIATSGLPVLTMSDALLSGAARAPRRMRSGHTWAVMGALTAALNVPEFYVPMAAGQRSHVAGVRARIGSGTSVVAQLQRNGTNVGPAITVTPTATTTTFVVTLADGDTLDLVLSAPSGSPTDLSLTVILEHATSP